MEMQANEVIINGRTYVEKETINAKSEPVDGMEYVIIRTHSAGVFAGYVKSRNGEEVTLVKARRLWYWSGAASLSQLAVDGVGNPDKCKFPCEVSSVDLLGVIEVLSCTNRAKSSIAGVEIWTA